ncbi:MAG: hypothetical protein U1D69_06735, partial [Polynucleobacter sp.]|nr:hypothetical protein [Polynucleobacter sp.]
VGSSSRELPLQGVIARGGASCAVANPPSANDNGGDRDKGRFGGGGLFAVWLLLVFVGGMVRRQTVNT